MNSEIEDDKKSDTSLIESEHEALEKDFSNGNNLEQIIEKKEPESPKAELIKSSKKSQTFKEIINYPHSSHKKSMIPQFPSNNLYYTYINF